MISKMVGKNSMGMLHIILLSSKENMCYQLEIFQLDLFAWQCQLVYFMRLLVEETPVSLEELVILLLALSLMELSGFHSISIHFCFDNIGFDHLK